MPPARPAPVWGRLTDDQQLEIARTALRHASETIAGQAEILAIEFDRGVLLDRGGADALRLFAAVLRITGAETAPQAGPPGPEIGLAEVETAGNA